MGNYVLLGLVLFQCTIEFSSEIIWYQRLLVWELLITNSIYLVITGIFRLLNSSWICFTNLWFLRNWYFFPMCKLFRLFSYSSLNECRMCNDRSHFIFDIGDLCLLSFYVCLRFINLIFSEIPFLFDQFFLKCSFQFHSFLLLMVSLYCPNLGLF